MHKRNPASTPRSEPRVKASFRLPRELLAALDAMRDRLNADPSRVAPVTRTDVAALAIREGLAITKSSLNDFLNGRNNGGLGVQRALAGYLRQPIENVLAAGNLTKLRAGKIKSTEVVFGKLPLWPELLAGARSIDPSVPEWCWTMVAEATVWIHKPVTSAMVCDLARFFRAHFQPPAMR